jgi:hypothetical protein
MRRPLSCGLRQKHTPRRRVRSAGIELNPRGRNHGRCVAAGHRLTGAARGSSPLRKPARSRAAREASALKDCCQEKSSQVVRNLGRVPLGGRKRSSLRFLDARLFETLGDDLFELPDPIQTHDTRPNPEKPNKLARPEGFEPQPSDPKSSPRPIRAIPRPLKPTKNQKKGTIRSSQSSSGFAPVWHHLASLPHHRQHEVGEERGGRAVRLHG